MSKETGNASDTNDPDQGPDVVVPPDVFDKGLWRLVIIFEFITSLVGTAFSAVLTVGGVSLILHGITGSGSWSADIFGVRISDAEPGVVLLLIGLAVYIYSRFDVQVARTVTRLSRRIQKINAGATSSASDSKQGVSQVRIKQYTPGSSTTATILGFEEAAGRYVLELPGNVRGVLSTYDVSDDDLDQMKPGQTIFATVDRVEFDAHGAGQVILTKDPQPIAH
jgi:hypothetical protein